MEKLSPNFYLDNIFERLEHKIKIIHIWNNVEIYQTDIEFRFSFY